MLRGELLHRYGTKVKNDWFQQKAKDIELRVLHGESGGAYVIFREAEVGYIVSITQDNKKQ